MATEAINYNHHQSAPLVQFHRQSHPYLKYFIFTFKITQTNKQTLNLKLFLIGKSYHTKISRSLTKIKTKINI